MRHVVRFCLISSALLHATNAYAVDIFYASSYGVVCDGTNIHDQLQNAINAAQINGISSTGAILQLPSGFCAINGNLLVSHALTVRGTGSGVGFGTGNSGGTVLRSSCASCDHFTVTDVDQFVLRDVTLDKGEIPPTGGAGVNISLAGSNINRRSRIENVTMLGLYYGVFLVNAANFSIVNNHIQDFRAVGVYVAATATSYDLGDSNIQGNTIWDFPTTSGEAGIRLDPAAGIEVIGNKVIGGNYGIRLTVSQGPTGTLNVSSNSFEQHNVAEIYVQQTAATKKYSFITVVGNQFQAIGVSNYQAALILTNNAAQYLSNVVVNSNVFRICSVPLYGFVNMQSVDGATIVGNVFDRCGNTGVSTVVLGTNALNVTQANNVTH